MCQDAIEKARKVRMVILDVDGVLTDGKVLYAGRDLVGVSFDVRDGSGIKYLQRSGIRTAIISGRDTEAVVQRARALNIEDVMQGAKVKLEPYERLRERAELADEEIAYMGDDLPDIPVMRRAGLAVTVPNAPPEVIEQADLVTERSGGNGAVRELAEFILKAQDKWAQVLERYRD